MASNGKLTYKQRKAIAALLSEPTVQRAAEKAGVGERTLHRWLDENLRFQEGLTLAESRAIDKATRRLVILQDEAIQTIEEIMTDDNAPASTRLRAATSVLDYLLKLRELRNVEQRLAALEEAYNAQDG